jgi:hypothetical protein
VLQRQAIPAGMISFAHKKFYLSNFVFNLVLSRFNRSLSVVIADSYDAKKDIIKHYNIKEEKVKVTYLGGGDFFKQLDKDLSKQKIRDKYGISKAA